MNCAQFELEASDYSEGLLAADSRRACDGHLATCAACRVMVADVRAIVAAAQQLDTHVPSPQVWMRIAAAIEAERPSGLRAFLGLGAGSVAWRPALAVTSLVILLTGGSWLSWREVVQGGKSAGAPAAGTQAQALQSVETEMRLAEDHYARAISSLEQIARSDAGSLDGQTAAVLHENLTVIDRAIGESRAALQNEPANDLAQDSLFGALRSKVALLQDTVSLINEMRKGNQEGAARIVSGLSQ